MNKFIKYFTVLIIPALLYQYANGETDPRDYFPLTPGSQWKYNTYRKDKKKSFIMAVRIDKPQKYKGKEYHILTQKDKRGIMRSFLEVKEDGVFVKKTGVRKAFTPEASAIHEPSIPLFLFTLKKGYTFHWEGILKIVWIKKNIILDGEILGEDTITVPAGTFTCIKLHFRQKRGKKVTDEYAWYAPGVGQVKYIGGTYIKELIEYNIKNQRKIKN